VPNIDATASTLFCGYDGVRQHGQGMTLVPNIGAAASALSCRFDGVRQYDIGLIKVHWNFAFDFYFIICFICIYALLSVLANLGLEREKLY
jgi:hypothetical protein